MHQETDESLMTRVGDGDRRAYSALVERHLGRSVALAWRILGNKTEAEDAAQDAFLRVWTTASRWQPRGARFTTWLYRVVMNLCIDRKRRNRSVPLDAAAESADPGPSAFGVVAGAEVQRQIKAALAALPERQRVAIALCYYEGMSNIEAAEVMELSIGAVESLLVRARKTLRETLAPSLAGALEDTDEA